MYKDLDGNGIINSGNETIYDPGDRKIIGNNSLRFQYGINGGLSWNNFSFSFLLQGVGKCDKWKEKLKLLDFGKYRGLLPAFV